MGSWKNQMDFRRHQSTCYLHYVHESLAVLVKKNRRRGKRLFHPASSVSRIENVLFLHRGYTSIVVAALLLTLVAVLATAVKPLILIAEEPISFVLFSLVGVVN